MFQEVIAKVGCDVKEKVPRNSDAARVDPLAGVRPSKGISKLQTQIILKTTLVDDLS